MAQPLRHLVDQVAHEATARIVKRVRSALVRMRDMLSGDDSPLLNIWEEFCAEVQFQESVFWEADEHTARALVEKDVARLKRSEQPAIWLLTDADFDWLNAPSSNEIPVAQDQVVTYLYDRLLSAAADYQSPSLDLFLER